MIEGRRKLLLLLLAAIAASFLLNMKQLSSRKTFNRKKILTAKFHLELQSLELLLNYFFREITTQRDHC